MPPNNPKKPPQEMPKLSSGIEFNPNDSGVTLTTDAQTLREIDKIHEEVIKAAQATRKFAWR